MPIVPPEELATDRLREEIHRIQSNLEHSLSLTPTIRAIQAQYLTELYEELATRPRPRAPVNRTVYTADFIDWAI